MINRHFLLIGTNVDQLQEEFKQIQSILNIYPDEELCAIQQEFLYWIEDNHPEYEKEMEKLKEERQSKVEMADMLFTCHKKSTEANFNAEVQLLQNEFDYSYATYSRGCVGSIYESNLTNNPKNICKSAQIPISIACTQGESQNQQSLNTRITSSLLSPVETADEDLYSIYSQYKGEHRDTLLTTIRNKTPSTNTTLMNAPIPTRQNLIPIAPYDSNYKTNQSPLPFLKSHSIDRVLPQILKKPLFHMHSVEEETEPVNIMARQGHLRYNEIWFKPGDTLVVENRKGMRMSGVIQSVTGTEIWICRPDGSTKRLYLSHLRKKKYCILTDHCIGGTLAEDHLHLEKASKDAFISSTPISTAIINSSSIS